MDAHPEDGDPLCHEVQSRPCPGKPPPSLSVCRVQKGLSTPMTALGPSQQMPVEHLLGGKYYLGAGVKQRTDRQLALLLQGKNNNDCARRLGVVGRKIKVSRQMDVCAVGIEMG